MLIVDQTFIMTILDILVGNTIVDHWDVAGALPVGSAAITSSFSPKHLDSMDWTDTTATWDEKHLSLGI